MRRKHTHTYNHEHTHVQKPCRSWEGIWEKCLQTDVCVCNHLFHVILLDLSMRFHYTGLCARARVCELYVCTPALGVCCDIVIH